MPAGNKLPLMTRILARATELDVPSIRPPDRKVPRGAKVIDTLAEDIRRLFGVAEEAAQGHAACLERCRGVRAGSKLFRELEALQLRYEAAHHAFSLSFRDRYRGKAGKRGYITVCRDWQVVAFTPKPGQQRHGILVIRVD